MEDILMSWGMERYESRAIIHLLKEELTLKELCKKADIPYGKVYSVVKKLKERGIVNESSSWPKKVFIADPSGTMRKIIDMKMEKEQADREKITRLVSEIEIARSMTPGLFQIGTTNEENEKIQLEAFRMARKEMLQIFNVHHRPKSNRRAKSLWEKEIVSLLKKGIMFKAIYPPGSSLPPILEDARRTYSNFSVRYKHIDFVSCDIIDSHSVLLKLVNEDPILFGGVLLIRSERLNGNLRKVFESFWEGALIT
jgi:sugar-specific transcriptional regulator TrmB